MTRPGQNPAEDPQNEFLKISPNPSEERDTMHVQKERIRTEANKRRDLLKREISSKEMTTNPMTRNKDFWTDQAVEDGLLKPFYDIQGTYNAKLEALKADNKLSLAEKEVKAEDLINEAIAEFKIVYENAQDLIAEAAGGRSKFTDEAIAKLEVYGEKFAKLMTMPEGRPLVEIFGDFIRGSALTPSHKKVLTEAITSYNKDLQLAALFILSLGTEEMREEFTTGFINEHGQEAAILLEIGSRYGYYSPTELKKYFEICAKTDHPLAKKFGEKRLKNFDRDLNSYEARYDVHKEIEKHAKSLKAQDAKGGASEYLNAYGVGRAIGTVMSLSAVITHVVANRKLAFGKDRDIKEFLNAPYAWGGVGLFSYLHYSKDGESIADHMKGTDQRAKEARIDGLNNLNRATDDYFWNEFLSNDEAADAFARYSNELRDNVLLNIPTTSGFAQWCEKHAPKVVPLFTKVLKSGDSATRQKEFDRLVKSFQALTITTAKEYKEKLIDAKRQSV